METYLTNRVFVPGGMPSYTYVGRESINLEKKLNDAVRNSFKLITVTGQTKSGKTVLVNTIFSREDSKNIWIDGGTIDDEDDFWTAILQETGYPSSIETREDQSASKTYGANFDGSAGIIGTANLGAGIKGEKNDSNSRGVVRIFNSTPKVAAVKVLLSNEFSIVVDDFHYIDRALQGSLVRALKPIIFNGVSVVLIAIPHRRYDAVRVEKEITGRVINIEVPSWSEEELVRIPNIGFPLLNAELNETECNNFAKEAYGSPHLMQEFCQRCSYDNGLSETALKKMYINKIDNNLYHSVAIGTSKVIYDKLSKGPRQRADRISRTLNDGSTTDIYGVVLKALSDIGPGLATIEYEQLRGSIRNILKDSIPQAQEVTRVLARMAEIAANDESSTPVIDWDKEEQKLHITDPFFAFYLKWGDL